MAKEYEVEIILFQHTGPDTSANEIWNNGNVFRSDPVVERILGAREASGNENDTALSSKKLAHLADRLRASPNYKVLEHKGWQQGLQSKAKTPVVGIRSTTEPVVLGTMRVYGGHFIRTELELLLQPNSRARVQHTSSGGLTYYGRAYGAAAQYTLSESRRVKLNEVHYLDHPMFGAIIQVRPL